jgi:hypothetical protein
MLRRCVRLPCADMCWFAACMNATSVFAPGKASRSARIRAFTHAIRTRTLPGRAGRAHRVDT